MSPGLCSPPVLPPALPLSAAPSWVPSSRCVHQVSLPLNLTRYTNINSKWHTDLKVEHGDFPGCPVVKTLPSSAGGEGSIPGGRARIPHVSRPKTQNIKQKQYCKKFNTFKKMVHIKKENL